LPAALLTGCPGDGDGRCPQLVEPGQRCPAHTRRPYDRYRGSASSRGYGATWRAFKERFRQRLIAAGIMPACGASLPTGPVMTASRCRAEGFLNDQRLHLHHDPPLQADERRDRAAVEDENRVGYLCESCHAAETAREMAS